MPEMPESAITELAQYRAIAPSPSEAARKIADLEKDNQKEREKVRDLTEKVKAIPPEGAVVLTGDAAKAHEAFTALGVKPEEVATIKAERDDLSGKLKERERKDAFAKVAKLGDYSEDAIATMLDMQSLNGAAWEFKATKVKDPKSGKDVDTEEAWLTLPGDGQKPQKFTDFAATAPQLKGLKLAGGGNDGIPSRIVPEQRGDPGNGKAKTLADFKAATDGTAEYNAF